MLIEFERLFLERKSVRAYRPEPVADDVRKRVLDAALRSPTAGNQALYSIIEIEDLCLKARLSETCDHQPFIAAAPWVLVFLADFARLMAYFDAMDVGGLCARTGREMQRPRESDLLLACCDAIVAAQTAACAAEAVGLGSCYIGDIMENLEIHRELLGLPKYAFPIAMLCLGWPTDQQKARPQPPRISREFIVHRDRYAMPSADALRSMYRGPGWRGAGDSGGLAENEGQALYLRKFSAPFSAEMRRSVAIMLEDWR